MTTVVATVLCWNNEAGVREVLRRLALQSRPPDSVVVLDNGSTRPLVLEPESIFAGVFLLSSGTNLGVGAGHNRLIRHALDEHDADLVWLLEHDTFPNSDCLESLMRVRRATTTNSVIATELVRNNYERDWLPGRSADGEPLDRVTLNGPLIPRTVIDLVGLLNESLFVGQEDWEYSDRLRRASVAIVRAASAVALHANKGDGRFDSYVSPARLYYSARNLIAADRRNRAKRAARVGAAAFKELVTPGRGAAYAAARVNACSDGLRGRLGPRSYRFMER